MTSLFVAVTACGSPAVEAGLDALSGQWQARWSRSRGRPRALTGTLHVLDKPDGPAGRLRFTEHASTAVLTSLREGSPLVLQFAWGEETLTATLSRDRRGFSGPASVPGRHLGTLSLWAHERPGPLVGPWRRPVPPSLPPTSPLRDWDPLPPPPHTKLSDRGDVLWQLREDWDVVEPSSRPWPGGAPTSYATVPWLPRWWSPLPDGRSAVAVSDEGHVVTIGGAELARVPGRVHAVVPEWADDRLLVWTRPPDGGTRVVAVSVRDGAQSELAAHATADDLLLDGRYRPRAVVRREKTYGGRGVSRDRVRVEELDGTAIVEGWQPEWVVDRAPTPRIGDAPIRLLVGGELARLEPAVHRDEAWADTVEWLVDDDGRVDAVAWNAERLHWVPTDAVRDDFAWLERTLDGDFTVEQRVADDERWLLRTWSGDAAPRFAVYDRSPRALHLLGPDPEPVPGHLEARVIEVRDGTRLAAYVTTPGPGRWPLVVHVHGGPWSGRHVFRRDETAHALAERGYATLQVNFRGTYGFGWSRTHGADAGYGGAMIGDLEDAIDQLVAEGTADPERIAMLGHSYGGYAGLRFATAETLRIRCAVAGMVRTPIATGDELDAAIRRLRVPVLIWNGGLDEKNADQVVRDFVDRAIAAGRDAAWIRFPWEHHGLAELPNRHAQPVLEDRFLSTCLGGPAWDWPSDFGDAELEVRAGVDLVPGLAEVTEPAP